jgi:hypothetical protein
MTGLVGNENHYPPADFNLKTKINYKHNGVYYETLL